MTIESAIQLAEKLLPGVEAPEGETDPRWQAIIEVASFIETNPKETWNFISKWGRSNNEDLRTAIATCALEHFLEFHFNDYFALVEGAVKSDANFADTFSRCWKLGQSALPENSVRFDRLHNLCSSSAV
jgi:hypothetical protein